MRVAVVTAQAVLHVSVHIGWVAMGGGESKVDIQKRIFFLSIFWFSIDNGK